MTPDSDSGVRSLMTAAIGAAREEMIAGRQRIKEMHLRGLDGLQTCGRLTSLVDGVLGRLFDAAEKDLGASAPANLRSRLALVALGSYGRRQWAPYSDVDLMILHDGLTPERTSPETATRRAVESL